jgi:hypothetical protein
MLSEKEPGNFIGELRFKTNFSVRTGCCFARFICFIIFIWILGDFFCLKVFEVGTGQ